MSEIDDKNRKDEERLLRVCAIIAVAWIFFLICLTFGANHTR